MSTLDAAFQNVGLIYCVYITLILAYGVFSPTRLRRKAMVIALINHGGLIGLAVILTIPFISPFAVDLTQFITGILIEVFCASVFFMSSLQIIKFLQTKAKVIPDRYLLLLIILKVLFFIANFSAAGGQYGIFSDDSRIDFLTISPILAKTWYLEVIIDFIVFSSLTILFIEKNKLRLRDNIFILTIIILNFLTGSKGASFLMMAYVALFSYAAFPHITSLIPKWIILLLAIVFSVIIFGYIYVLSELLQVTFSDQFNLTMSRFLLSADARIMAFDPNISSFVLSQPHGAFLSELFRGVARIFDLKTAEFPIGVYQYQYQVNAVNFVGSTNQLSAMFVIYGGSFWLLEFIVIASVVWLSYQFLRYSIRSNKSSVRWVAAASFFFLSDSLGKGFDAFVQMLPICVILISSLSALPQWRLVPRRILLSPNLNSGNLSPNE